MHTSDFVRDAIRDKLAAIKTIKYRDVDYETAKKEVRGYFREALATTLYTTDVNSYFFLRIFEDEIASLFIWTFNLK
jgi:hypothetical protein